MEVPDEDLSTLTDVERFALGFAGWMNGSLRRNQVRHWINTNIHRRILTLLTGRRIHLVGIEKMRTLRPDRGVLIASNHRSFLDQYITGSYLYQNVSHWKQFFFPVRSGFWYETRLGVLLNLLVSTSSMFPPIFRAREKRGVTRVGLRWLADKLANPNTLVGIHPEGTRSNKEDPYELLPAEPGFGRVVLQSRPIVVPIFANGMGNNAANELKQNFLPNGRPVIIVYGDPVDYSEFDGEDPTLLRNQVKVGRKVLAEVAKLAEVERALRHQLRPGSVKPPSELSRESQTGSV